MSHKSFSCRISARGGVTLPPALVTRLSRDGVTCLHAGFADGQAVLLPLDRNRAAITRLSPLLALLDADFASADSLGEGDFGPAAAKAFPVGLDAPVPGPVGL